MSADFDFSLVLCTLNRRDEVAQFLASLKKQDAQYRIQLIVVDQNTDDRIPEVLKPYQNDFEICLVKTQPGLSRARNLGLQYALGNIIGFPDDDCTYPETLLTFLYRAFAEDPQRGGISTLVTDEAGNFSAGGRMYRTPCTITKKNVWWCGVSPSIFVRRSALGGICFDEELGVGSGTVFGSGEETDFLLMLLEAGVRLDYMPQAVVYHPRFTGPWKRERGWLYGCGMGRVLRKHGASFFTVFYYALLQQVRAAQSFCTLKFRKMLFHLAMSYGRLYGYLAKRQREKT